MSIGGKVRENNFEVSKKYVGLFVGNVVAVNPSIEEYQDVLGISLKEDSKATDYLGEKDGNKTLRLNIWLEEPKTGFKHPVTFFLENKVKSNKDETKFQYINNVGATSWVSNEEDLKDWFKKREYRKAYVGEQELYDFLRLWLGKLDLKDNDTVLELDWKQLMKGNTKEIRALINGDYAVPVGAMAEIKTVDGEDGPKVYQSIYNRAFFPEYSLKFFRLVNYNDPNEQAKIKAKQPKDRKAHEKFVYDISGEYGSKNFYLFSDLKEYDPSENVVAGGNVIINEDDSSY